MSERQEAIDSETAADGDAGDQAQRQAYDPLAALTVAEVRVASRELGADVVAAITGRTEHYSDALARVLWMHQRRADRTRNPAELWKAIDGMTYLQLQDALGELAEEGAGPTTPQP